jgi:hypothetical protein
MRCVVLMIEYNGRDGVWWKCWRMMEVLGDDGVRWRLEHDSPFVG